ncbi:hypothetical protein [Bradyrhizobium manausense]|uniref:hypothetical protein n=1 Tax=Bradyrhizobium manausense TaxID=989370 RepID=UPI001BADC14C|nr:hypothetical protein [Bradyrhizobium manausense]MBR0721750.1 hypothetical protein [Bradyrhizobium manausense]
MPDEYQMLREKVALEYGFALYRNYMPKQAAEILKIDLSTIKRWTGKKRILSKQFGADGVRYMGIELADVIIKGTRPWDDTPSDNSSSDNTSSDSAKAPLPGIAAGAREAGPSASLSARRILRKPSSD